MVVNPFCYGFCCCRQIGQRFRASPLVRPNRRQDTELQPRPTLKSLYSQLVRPFVAIQNGFPTQTPPSGNELGTSKLSIKPLMLAA